MLWILEDSSSLSSKARKTIIDGRNELFWSAASLWELTVKLSLKKLVLSSEWREALLEEKSVNRIQDLPVREDHCFQHLELPWHHRDPFDRLLICQAMSEKMTIITKDKSISQYKVKTLW